MFNLRYTQLLIHRARQKSDFKQVINYSSDKEALLENRRKEMIAKCLPKQKPIHGVKHIVLVASGKGGVGKSTTAVNLAVALQGKYPQKGIGILDTDVFGPSIPLMMNLKDTPMLTKENLMKPLMNYGVLCMSLGFLIAEDAPVIWRGLMVMQALEKLMRQVDWGEIDYLIVDTPPGTGDTLLSLVQNLPIAGVVVVTTPQAAALAVTQRGVLMLKKLNIPVIGIVENMKFVQCTTCTSKIKIFGEGTSKLAQELDCEILGSLPLNIDISDGSNKGVPVVIEKQKDYVSLCYTHIAESVVNFCEKIKN